MEKSSVNFLQNIFCALQVWNSVKKLFLKKVQITIIIPTKNILDEVYDSKKSIVEKKITFYYCVLWVKSWSRCPDLSVACFQADFRGGRLARLPRQGKSQIQLVYGTMEENSQHVGGHHTVRC